MNEVHNSPIVGHNDRKGGHRVSKDELQFARKAWLNYYNDYLRAHAIIKEEAWRHMRTKIAQTK